MYLRIFMLTLMFLLCLPVANAVECSVVFPGGQSFAGSGSIVTGANRPLCNGVDCVFENFTSVGAINLDTNRGGFPSSNDSWTFADAEYNYYTNAPANENYSLFTLGDTSAIYISGSVVFKKGIGLNAPSTGTGKPSELLIVVDGDLKIEENAVVNGFIYVNGNVILEKGIIFNGAVSATGSFDVKENGRYTFDPSMLDGFDPHGFCESATSQPITPILNYRFDECSYSGGAGEVIDQTTNYPGTAFSSVDTTELGQIERFVDISDANHHIETSVPLPASYSVSTWFKKPTSNAGSPYFVLGAMQNGGDLLYIDRGNGWRWGVYDGSNPTNGTYSFSPLDSNWHHLTLVYSGGQTKLYVDGTLEDTINRVPSGTLQYIGTSFDNVNGSNPQGFRAPLDEFMVYDQALTQPEISTIYNNQVTNKNYDGTTRDVVVCGLLEAVAGRVTLNNTANDPSFTHVCFDTPFSDVPVVFSLPTTASNGDRLALRIRNVTTEGFDIAQVESPEKANPNAPAGNVAQTVDFLAVVEGDYDLDGGAKMRVRALNTWRYQGRAFSGKSWETVSTADLGFTQTPAIIASIQTMNNEPNISNTTGPFPISEPFLATTIKDVTNTEFKIALERGETNTGVVINNETMGYIAITPGFQGQLTTDISYESFRTDNNIRGINSCRIFNLSGLYIDNPLIIASQNTRAGSDGGWLKRCAISTSSAGFSIVEDRDRDNDTGHIDERAGGLALSGTFTDFANSCAVPIIDHFEIAHDGQGLTCEAESITIKACANSSCTTLNPDDVNVQLSINGTFNQTVTVSGGSTDINFSYTNVGTATLSLAQGNTCENGSSTSCDLLFADAGFRFLYGTAETTVISHQTSGNNFAGIVKLQAVENVDGVCTGLFTGDKEVELSQQNIAPGGTTGLSFHVNNNSIEKYPAYTPDITLNFGADSKATLPTPQYLDAGQIRLHAKYDVDGVNLVGNSNDFWVSPDKLIVSASSGGSAINGSSNISTTIHKAGQVFDFTVTAYNSLGNAAANITTNYLPNDIQLLLTRTGPDPTNGGVDGTFNYGNGSLVGDANLGYQSVTLTAFNSGVSYSNSATYSEVGLINLDLQDEHYGFTNNIINADAINMGRFYPDHFDVSITSNSFLDTCIEGTAGFTYIGQPFLYSDAPELLITAKNGLSPSTLTQNYTQEGYQKLINTNVVRTFPIEDTNQNGADTSTKMVVAPLTDNGSLEIDSNGVLKYTFNTSDSFTFSKNSNSLIAPFTMVYDIAINSIEDSDGANASISLASDTPTSNTVSPTGVNLRFGRWNIENTFGPETSVLSVPMAIQYWDGNSFVTKDAVINKPDNCTSFNAVNLTIDNTNINPGITAASGSGIFVDGETRSVVLSAPGTPNQGAVPIVYIIPSMPWLLYDWSWDGVTAKEFNENPFAVATFGIFRGNDRIIYQREIAK